MADDAGERFRKALSAFAEGGLDESGLVDVSTIQAADSGDLFVYRGVPSRSLAIGKPFSAADDVRLEELMDLPQTPQTLAEGQELLNRKRSAGGQFFTDQPNIARSYAGDSGSVHALRLKRSEVAPFYAGEAVTPRTPGPGQSVGRGSVGYSTNFMVPDEVLKERQLQGQLFSSNVPSRSIDQELTESLRKPRVSEAAADVGRGLAVSSKVGALSPAEYNRAVELSNLIQEGQNKIDKLEMSPNQNAKIRQRIKNLKFQSYEAQRGFDRVIRAGDSTQQAMLRGLNSFSKQLPQLPREGVPFSYPDLPEATMTPLESPRVTTRRLLRGGLKALSTVVKVREAVLLGSDVGKHGLYEGTKESIGRLGGETGDLINVVGRGVSAVVPETPEFYAKAGVSPPPSLAVARQLGSLLSSVGSFIGKAHSFGPQDDLDREREREEERERVRNIPSNPSSPSGD